MHAGLIALAALLLQAAAPPSIARMAGTDADSGIVYALITTEGRLVDSATAPEPAPRLTAQCTLKGDQPKFELLVDFGGGPELTYIAPKKLGPGQYLPLPLNQVWVTMDFLGYTKVKPVKRRFDLLEGPLAGELRYATPGFRSPNLEPIGFYMQFLKALPTLRLTLPGRGVLEFETIAWQAAVKAEPLCRMSGL